ncbi:hypothetical protein BR93DRAFT_935042 [Coniochaeta sp. PMI_546]|nr:hypothetical protein BR93DRAFT_935042 [Coniochaeta sp. PMI_546]
MGIQTDDKARENATGRGSRICSDLPIVCYAAEWGEQWMVRTLRRQSPVLDVATKDGSGPLHFLNFHTTSELIREIKEIPGVIDLPVLNSDGRSPAETIFLAFKPSIEEPNDNAHPSNNAALDRIAYMELLTEEVCKSRDEQGRTLWERFCRDVVLYYAAKKAWRRVADAITVAVSCFVERGVVREYETLSGHCAFFELLRMICGDFTRVGMPSWLPAIYLQLIRATTSMKIQLLKDDPGIYSFLQLMQRRDAFEYRELFTVLDSMGVPIVNSPG